MGSFFWAALVFLFVLPYDVYSTPLKARRLRGYDEDLKGPPSLVNLNRLDWKKFGYEETDLEFSLYEVKVRDVLNAEVSNCSATPPVVMADRLEHAENKVSELHMSDLLKEFSERRGIEPGFLALANVNHIGTRAVLTKFPSDGYFTPEREEFHILIGTTLGKMANWLKPVKYIYVADPQCSQVGGGKGGPTLVFSYIADIPRDYQGVLICEKLRAVHQTNRQGKRAVVVALVVAEVQAAHLEAHQQRASRQSRSLNHYSVKTKGNSFEYCTYPINLDTWSLRV